MSGEYPIGASKSAEIEGVRGGGGGGGGGVGGERERERERKCVCVHVYVCALCVHMCARACACDKIIKRSRDRSNAIGMYVKV